MIQNQGKYDGNFVHLYTLNEMKMSNTCSDHIVLWKNQSHQHGYGFHLVHFLFTDTKGTIFTYIM